MANWIVGGLLALLVVVILRKLVADKRAGKSHCSCGGDCSHCSSCPHSGH